MNTVFSFLSVFSEMAADQKPCREKLGRPGRDIRKPGLQSIASFS